MNSENQTKDTKPKGWRSAVRGNVLAMGLVSFFTDCSSEMINPLLPLFLAGLAATQNQESLVIAAFYLGIMQGVAETISAMFKIFSGRVSDYLGKRKTLVLLGYGLSSIVRPAISVTNAIWQVIAIKSLDRMGKGIRTSPRDALISDSVDPNHRGLAFSFHRSMDHAGAVIGPLAAILILYFFFGKIFWEGSQNAPSPEEMAGLRFLFGISIIPGIFAMLCLFFLVKEIPPQKSSSQDAGKKVGWKDLPGRLYVYTAIVTLFDLGNSSDMFIILLAKVKFGFSLSQLILVWMALHVFKIVFSFPGGILSDKIERRTVIAIGYVLYFLSYLGFAFMEHPWQFWTILALYGGFYGFSEGAEKAMVADIVPSELRATAFGVYHVASGLAIFPASFVFGFIWKTYGPTVSFGIGACCAMMSAILLLIAVPPVPKSK